DGPQLLAALGELLAQVLLAREQRVPDARLQAAELRGARVVHDAGARREGCGRRPEADVDRPRAGLRVLAIERFRIEAVPAHEPQTALLLKEATAERGREAADLEALRHEAQRPLEVFLQRRVILTGALQRAAAPLPLRRPA